MEMNWHDLTKPAQRAYLDYYAAKHASWNGISVEEAKERLVAILTKIDDLFEVQNIGYEKTR